VGTSIDTCALETELKELVSTYCAPMRGIGPWGSAVVATSLAEALGVHGLCSYVDWLHVTSLATLARAFMAS
jgi:hypothetical protein